jgi:hypothetical protein
MLNISVWLSLRYELVGLRCRRDKWIFMMCNGYKLGCSMSAGQEDPNLSAKWLAMLSISKNASVSLQFFILFALF